METGLADSRWSMMRRQTSQRKWVTARPCKKECSLKADKAMDEQEATNPRALQDLAMKKLEQENEHLRDQLEHARDIIRQLLQCT